MNDHGRSDFGEIEHPCGIACAHIHTSVAHRVPKIVVPVGAVDAITGVKIHGIGHVGQVIPRSSHICVQVFDINVISACNCRMGCNPGGYHERIDKGITVVGVQHLLT